MITFFRQNRYSKDAVVKRSRITLSRLLDSCIDTQNIEVSLSFRHRIDTHGLTAKYCWITMHSIKRPYRISPAAEDTHNQTDMHSILSLDGQP